MKIESWLRIFSCPMYSSSIRGRSARSTTSSCTPATLVVTMRFTSSFSIVIARFQRAVARALRLREELQCLTDSVADGDSLGELLHRRGRFLVAVPEREQRVQHVGHRRRRTVDANGRRD